MRTFKIHQQKPITEVSEASTANPQTLRQRISAEIERAAVQARRENLVPELIGKLSGTIADLSEDGVLTREERAAKLLEDLREGKIF